MSGQIRQCIARSIVVLGVLQRARQRGFRAGTAAAVAMLLLLPSLLAATPAHAATIVVTSLADAGACPSATTCTLRGALAAASAGDTIQFGVAGTVNLSSTLVVTRNVTIQGPGAPSLIVDGRGAVRVFEVEAGVQATFSGITIQNGKVSDTGNNGAGILNRGALTVHNSVVANNRTDAAGGGIFSENSVSETFLSVVNSTLRDNRAGSSGGGIWNGNLGTLSVTGSTLHDNHSGKSSDSWESGAVTDL